MHKYNAMSVMKSHVILLVLHRIYTRTAQINTLRNVNLKSRPAREQDNKLISLHINGLVNNESDTQRAKALLASTSLDIRLQ